MRKRLLATLKRHEIYLAAAVIAAVFVTAVVIVAWLLRSSIMTPPYEMLSDAELKKVFATAYLRFREDDGTPYLKVELHNGTLWWIKKVDFEFDGTPYSLRDSDLFRPLHFGAVRCGLRRAPAERAMIEYDLKILKAYGYPPAHVGWHRAAEKSAGESADPNIRN